MQDGTLVEINPMVETHDGKVGALSFACTLLVRLRFALRSSRCCLQQMPLFVDSHGSF